MVSRTPTQKGYPRQKPQPVGCYSSWWLEGSQAVGDTKVSFQRGPFREYLPKVALVSREVWEFARWLLRQRRTPTRLVIAPPPSYCCFSQPAKFSRWYQTSKNSGSGGFLLQKQNLRSGGFLLQKQNLGSGGFLLETQSLKNKRGRLKGKRLHDSWDPVHIAHSR